MTGQAWIIMTTVQRDDATSLDDENKMLGARQIDNPLANNLGIGVLVGKWVAPARLLNDADYTRWGSVIGGLPIAVMDNDTLFIPPAPDI